jgi:hypothetical protein
LATIGVAGRHRSLRVSRSSALAADPRAGNRRAWLAPLLALLAIGLLPVLGRSLVWLGTAATEAPVSETTATAPAHAPESTTVPAPSATPSVLATAPAVATSSPSPATPSSSHRPATRASSAAPTAVGTVPPVAVVVPPDPDPDPDPATVQQPDGTFPPDTGTIDQPAPEPNTSTDPGPADQTLDTPVCCDPDPAGE